MDVLNSNFDEVLPDIERDIRAADFVCIDCEFTGLGGGSGSITAYDTPELVYWKSRQNVGDFMLMQFGMCCFRYDEKTDGFKYAAYNCYIYPRLCEQLNRIRDVPGNRMFAAFQPESLAMLAKHEFDFNKWIGGGVGYIRNSDAAWFRQHLTKRHEWQMANVLTDDKQALNIPDTMKKTIKRVDDQIKAYIKSNATAGEIDNIEPLILADLSSYERKITYKLIDHSYGQQLYVETRQEDGAMMLIYCANQHIWNKKQQKKLDSVLQLVEDSRGFCQVLDIIKTANKPVIAHNPCFDLMHSVKAFNCDLPNTLVEFKSLVIDMFPTFYDTKLLALQVKKFCGHNCSLRELDERTKETPFPSVKVECERDDVGYSDQTQFHNAAYDAYVTGLVFARMAVHLAKSKNVDANCEIAWPQLEVYRNKFAIPRVQDIPYLDMGIPNDIVPERENVFMLEMQSDNWNNADILRLFSPYGRIEFNWVNGRSVWITVLNKSNAATVYSTYCTFKPSTAGKPHSNNGNLKSSPAKPTKRRESEQIAEMLTAQANVSPKGSSDAKSKASPSDWSLHLAMDYNLAQESLIQAVVTAKTDGKSTGTNTDRSHSPIPKRQKI